MNHDTSTFLSGFAVSANVLVFSKEIDEVAKDDHPHAIFFVLNQDRWGQYKRKANWPAISMASVKASDDKRVALAIGPRGQLWQVVTASMVETFSLIPDLRWQLRSLSVIGERIYACGMGRIVRRREEDGQWSVLDAPVPAPDDVVVGFEDLAGYDPDDLYATGWAGEIWWRHDGRWQQIDSPVSANMNALVCASDGYVYAVGDNGAMVRGRGEAWTALDTGQTLNLMDVTEYDGSIYVVTDFSILKLQDDALIAETDFAEPDDVPATCLYLLRAADGVFSMGPKDLFRRTSGPWERLV